MEEANKNKDEHKNLSNKIQQTDQPANNNKENEKIISKNVTENIFHRHIKPLFLGV